MVTDGMNIQKSSRKVRLVVLAFLAFWFFVPIPKPRGILSITAGRNDNENSSVQVFPYECVHGSEFIAYEITADIKHGNLQIGLLDSNGGLLANHGFGTGQIKRKQEFGFKGKQFRPGEKYQIRVIEDKLAGIYAFNIFQYRSITLWQRFLLLWAVSMIAGGVLLTYSLLDKNKRHVLGWLGNTLLILCVASTTVVLYALFHETGHAIPDWLNGVKDISLGTMLGIDGRPMIRHPESLLLPHWLIAVRAISGLVLPVLVGNIFFVLWISKTGRQIRARSRNLDYILSFIPTAFTFSAMGIIISVFGLFQDEDYGSFIHNVQIPVWSANLILTAFSTFSLVLTFIVGKHLWSVVQQIRRDQS
ncbi:MAG: hypothetical protein V1794_09700 [Candidatus Glassbacteria bacterium]